MDSTQVNRALDMIQNGISKVNLIASDAMQLLIIKTRMEGICELIFSTCLIIGSYFVYKQYKHCRKNDSYNDDAKFGWWLALISCTVFDVVILAMLPNAFIKIFLPQAHVVSKILNF